MLYSYMENYLEINTTYNILIAKTSLTDSTTSF